MDCFSPLDRFGGTPCYEVVRWVAPCDFLKPALALARNLFLDLAEFHVIR